MIGVFAAVAARIMSRNVTLETDAYLVGTRYEEVKDNPEKLQALIDSSSTVIVLMMHETLSEDPDASAFTHVKWPAHPYA